MKNSFLDNVAKLASANGLNILLGFLTAPLYARLFNPDDIGIYALFLSLLYILSLFGTLRYELAVVLPKRDEEAANVWAVGLLILSALSLICAAAIGLGFGKLLRGTKYEVLNPFLGPVLAGFFLTSLNSLLGYWLARRRAFGPNSMAIAVSAVCSQLGAVAGGLLGFKTASFLIWLNIFSQMLGLSFQIRAFWRTAAPMRPALSAGEMAAVARRYKKFPLVEIWGAFLNTLSVQIAPFLLVRYFSLRTVGLYAQGARLIHLPMQFVGKAISQVFYAQAATARHENKLSELVERVMGALFLVGGAPFLVMALFGDHLFSIFLGARWNEAGVYTQILAGWNFLVFCGAPISSVVLTLNRQGAVLFFNLLMVVLRAAALVVGGIIGSSRWAIALFSLTGILLWLGYISVIFKMVRMPVWKTWLSMTRHLVPTLLLAPPLLGTRFLPAPLTVRLAAAAAVLAVFFGVMVRTNPIFRKLLNYLLSLPPIRRPRAAEPTVP